MTVAELQRHSARISRHLPDDEQRLRQQEVTACGPSEGVKTVFQHGIALGQVAGGCHPPMVACVQINGRNAP
jgi:hypothetical protein